MASIALEGANKAFGGVKAVDNVSLTVGSGEFLTLLGDSGCGKTTLLRIIAGFSAADSGRILVDGIDVTAKAPAARGMGFVFQSYALFPTKTVAGNIGFALAVRGEAATRRRARVQELAAMVELDGMLDRYPHELSGGQQQRVALARALAASPRILLLDEPLSALDARIRGKLRRELRELVTRLGLTAIYVTHDQEEAMALSDRIAVMRAGRVLQIDSPHAIYHHPSSPFVAGFIGAMNLIAAEKSGAEITVDGQTWPLAGVAADRGDGPLTLGLRPEAIRMSALTGLGSAAPGGQRLVGNVRSTCFLGGVSRAEVMVAGRMIMADWAAPGPPPPAGALVELCPDPTRAVAFAHDETAA